MALLDADEDDVTLHTRRSGGTAERRSMDMDERQADREVTLSTGTVLALFFTLALICAVFFGFGYSMGRKSAQPATASTDATVGTAAPIVDNSAAAVKPAPGSPAIQPIPGYLSQSAANAANAKAGSESTKAIAPPPAVESRDVASRPEPAPPAVEAAPATRPVAPVRIAPAMQPAPGAPVIAYNSAATAPAGGETYVQIAAVSHQEDADVLTGALKRRGYKVLARSDAGDKLIHVQIGPFSNRKDAEATRQKLLSDGYNAFLK